MYFKKKSGYCFKYSFPYRLWNSLVIYLLFHVSENSIVQWRLTDFLQDNEHHVSICLPFLGKSAVADLFLWLRMCIRDMVGMSI